MFLEETEILNYANDTTVYECGPNIENYFMHLEKDALKISEWFPNEYMKLEEGKSHLLIFLRKREQ